MNALLQYKNSQQSLADWGITKLERSRTNQGADRVRLEIPIESIGDTALFEPRQSVAIIREGQTWFRGIVAKTPALAYPRAECQQYELQGPLWFLEHLVYQQLWNEAIDPNNPDSAVKPIYKGRIILGQSDSGAPIGCTEQLEAIMRYAIAQGAPMALGQIDALGPLPWDESRDLSCAEAIRRVLRWAPEAVLYFDYTTALPTLHIRLRAQMPARTVAIGPGVRKLKITPRYDLVVPAVVLKYEKTHQAEGQMWTTTECDAFPPNATGLEFGALTMTLELEGLRATHIQQRVRTSPIEVHDISWWQAHVPALKSAKPGTIQLEGVTRSCALPYELLEGAIAPWMGRAVELDEMRALASFETEHASVVRREVVLRLHATDATTREYRKLVGHEEAQATPLGMAEGLYHQMSTLSFDGELEADAALELPGLGECLNLRGGRAQWQTMGAIVQGVHECLNTGVTRLVFGPAKHLGPDDLVERLRAARRRSVGARAQVRGRGKLRGHTALEAATHSKFMQSELGVSPYERLVFSDGHRPDCQVEINTKDLPASCSMRLQEEWLCHNGSLMRRMVLASDPYVPQGEPVS
ncbi:MAG TPA: hypothetical protein PLV25_01995 [Opitutales bacterium]|nr:hypothetical protein [Opitutales bacterium]